MGRRHRRRPFEKRGWGWASAWWCDTSTAAGAVEMSRHTAVMTVCSHSLAPPHPKMSVHRKVEGGARRNPPVLLPGAIEVAVSCVLSETYGDVGHEQGDVVGRVGGGGFVNRVQNEHEHCAEDSVRIRSLSCTTNQQSRRRIGG
ncbi:hypothetical protein GALMADRAFT_248784 [Galerina marginata CBS 339.88]|uniref:Uncharacterized protein n=1 Tax=Galerina marginata (strain CBS 339.88) TaxID=685588 RepID=A0A067SVP1_GALM3|nr:hypothetical protein GALMADRAFT_248784 [Galerina marginata CBS 339.88]